MADSATNIDLLSESQADKEETANELFDAGSPATMFGRRASTTTGLTWGYYGGKYSGASIANGTLTLTASTTNYVYQDIVTGAISVSGTASLAGKKLLYTIVTGTDTVTSYTDHRDAEGGAKPYIIGVALSGAPSDGQVITHVLPVAVTFPASATGSQAKSGVAAAATATVSLKKNGTEFATAEWSAAGTVGAFTAASATSFAAGDVLTIVFPATADTTLADVGITLMGYR